MHIAVPIAGTVFAMCLTLGYLLSPLRGLVPWVFLVMVGFLLGGLVVTLLHDLQRTYDVRSPLGAHLFFGALLGAMIGYIFGLLPHITDVKRMPERFRSNPDRSFEDDLRTFLRPALPIVACSFAGGVLVGLLATIFRV